MKITIKIGILVALLYMVEYKYVSVAAEEQAREVVMPIAVLIEVKPRMIAYLKVRQEQTQELASKYLKVVNSRLNKAANNGDIITAEAFKREKQRLANLQLVFVGELETPVKAVREGTPLVKIGKDEPEALKKMRSVWDGEWLKIKVKLDGELQKSLQKLESDLTKARDFRNAKAVFVLRKSLSQGLPEGSNASVTQDSGGSASKMVNEVSPLIKAAAKDAPFKNSLGMLFVPVPISGGPSTGKRVLFCVWETRVKDYQTFMKRNRQHVWQEPGFAQKSDHPAVHMTWKDAKGFCIWLTQKERKSGRYIGKGEEYRLPTDHEWSCAVGIGEHEDAEASPVSKKGGNANLFVWGGSFPPTGKVGNFYGEEVKRNPFQNNRILLRGYNDGFDRTAPVGSFEKNPLGLYDLGGNVSEWCKDWYDPNAKKNHLWRGGSWLDSKETDLLSSSRAGGNVDFSSIALGFRIVIAPVPIAVPAALKSN